MNNIVPSSQPVPSIPSIHIQNADDASALFDPGELFPAEMYGLYNIATDPSLYCSRGLQSEYTASNLFPSSELEDIAELSHLTTTTTQSFLTGPTFTLPYSILQDNSSADPCISPSSLGSPIPSPASSFGSSLSPSSIYESVPLSDSESPASPSPATPDQQFLWPSQVANGHHAYMGPFQNDPSFPPSHARHRPRSMSSPSARREPVASKAMLEANSRRRRHPAQFECQECKQTFTALFSLKRHAQSHTGERPFACSIPGCTQRFYNSSDCKRHEKSKKRHKDLMTE